MQEIVLILTILLSNGQSHDAVRRQLTIESCTTEGAAFIAQDPKDLDAMALGFACLQVPKKETI